MKDMLEQSEGKDDRIVADMMKGLRLVNRHWSVWANESYGVLRPPPDAPLETLVDVVAKSFINMRYLKLDKLMKIDDKDLATLCKLSTLTVLDITQSGVGSRNVTGKVVSSLGNQSALKEIHLARISVKISQDLGIETFAPCLTSLRKFLLSSYTYSISYEGARGIWGG